MTGRLRLVPSQLDAAPAVALRKRGAVQRAEWDDPEDTNERSARPWQVSGWCRTDPVRDLFPARSRQRDAADRLRRDVDVASGLREARGDGLSGGGCFGGPTDAMLDAIAAVRAACRSLTVSEMHAVASIVLDGDALEAFEASHHLRHGTAAVLVRGALLALANHYEIAARLGRETLSR